MDQPPAAQPTSRDLTKFQKDLQGQARAHESVVAGVLEVAEGVNIAVGAILDAFPALSEASNEDDPTTAAGLNRIVTGLGQILQAVADLHSLQAENIQRHADSLSPAIEQLRRLESGIVVPRLSRQPS